MKLLIVNGSPRAPRSNSRRYAELFQARWKGEARYAALTAKNHAELAAAAADCTDLLLVFPLYADGLPAPLLRFLEFLEGAGPEHRPRISVLINCGFLEPEQNDVAVEMVKNGDNGIPVPNYTDENVSTKVVKLIQSYTGVVNKMVWRKF